jgi:hypothetical protein
MNVNATPLPPDHSTTERRDGLVFRNDGTRKITRALTTSNKNSIINETDIIFENHYYYHA